MPRHRECLRNNVLLEKPFFVLMGTCVLGSIITVLLVMVLSVNIQGMIAYATSLSSSPSTMPSAKPIATLPAGNLSESIPSAESVHNTETLMLPPGIGGFVILIANEAHESWQDERHKLLTDRNAYYIPTNLLIYEGTEIAFLDADAPWDTPHPQTIDIVNKNTREVAHSTGVLDYANSSEPVRLPAGNYSIINQEYDAKEGNILVLPNGKSQAENASSQNIARDNLIVGGFYTPTNQVENHKDNEGVSHPGNLKYYREEFRTEGFTILGTQNFTYGICDYCPGSFWPDNKSGDHTLILYSTQQSLPEALKKLERLVRDNVYI